MDGWIKLSENDEQAVKYVNRRNIVSVNDMGGGGVVAAMWNGDTVRMKELPPDEPKLPYDAEVEYLESDGTQYILFSGQSINGIDCMIRPQSTSATVYGSVGMWNNGSRADTIKFNTVQSRNFCVSSGGGNGVNGFTLATGLSLAFRHVVVLGRNVTVDGNAYTWERGWREGGISGNNNRFALFGCFNTSNGTVNRQSCRIGHCALYSGQVKKFDLIPVRKGTAGYFYDRANPTGGPLGNGLYGNAADGLDGVTGFPANLVGPDKPKP